MGHGSFSELITFYNFTRRWKNNRYHVFDDNIFLYCTTFRCIFQKRIYLSCSSCFICLFSTILVIFACLYIMNYLYHFYFLFSGMDGIFNENVLFLFCLNTLLSTVNFRSSLIFTKLAKVSSKATTSNRGREF